MWVATRPPPGTCALAFDDQVVALDLDLDAVDAQHGGGGLQPVGFLDAQFLQAAHDAWCPRRRPPPPPAPDIRRSSRARAPAAPRRRAASRRARGTAPSARRHRREPALSSIEAPISRSVVNRPVRSGLVMTSDRTRSEPGTISAATIGNAAEDGSAGTTTPAPCSSGWPGQRDPAAMAALRRRDDLRPEMLQHLLGVVAGRFGLDHGGDRRAQPAPPAAPPT